MREPGRAAAGGPPDDQGPVDQPEQPLQDLAGLQAVAAAHRLGGRHRPATGEHRQSPPAAAGRRRRAAPSSSRRWPAGSAGVGRRPGRRRPAAGTGRPGGPRARPGAGPGPGPRPARWPAAARPGAGTARPPPAALSSSRAKPGSAARPARRTAAPRRSRPAPRAAPRRPARRPAPSAAGTARGGTGQTASPGTPRTSRLVASTRTAGPASSSRWTSPAHASDQVLAVVQDQQQPLVGHEGGQPARPRPAGWAPGSAGLLAQPQGGGHDLGRAGPGRARAASSTSHTPSG